MTLRTATATVEFIYDDSEHPNPDQWNWDDLLDVNIQGVNVTDRQLRDRYVIVNVEDVDTYVDDPQGQLLWWSNLYGWCSLEQASFFTEAETDGFFLPQEGEWIKL